MYGSKGEGGGQFVAENEQNPQQTKNYLVTFFLSALKGFEALLSG